MSFFQTIARLFMSSDNSPLSTDEPVSPTDVSPRNPVSYEQESNRGDPEENQTGIVNEATSSHSCDVKTCTRNHSKDEVESDFLSEDDYSFAPNENPYHDIETWIKTKCSEMDTVLEYVNEGKDMYINAVFQSWKTLVTQLCMIRLAMNSQNIIVVLDVNIKQAETFIFRWIMLRKQLLDEMDIEVPMIKYAGDAKFVPFTEECNIILCLRNCSQVNKIWTKYDENKHAGFCLLHDEYHMIHRANEKTSKYVKTIGEMMENADLCINISATHQDAIYDKVSKFGIDRANSSQFFMINPPHDHHGIEHNQWELSTPDTWAVNKSASGIGKIDPYFDSIYDQMFGMSGQDRQKRRVVYYRLSGKKIHNYPIISLYTPADTNVDQNVVFDYVRAKNYPCTVVITYNSEEIRLSIPDIYDDSIDFPILSRVCKKGETIGMSYSTINCRLTDDDYYVLPGSTSIQNILYWIYTKMQEGLPVFNIMIIAHDMAKQGQSF